MFCGQISFSLLVFVLSLSVDASPLAPRPRAVGLPFRTRISAKGHPNLLAADQARAAAFRSKASKRDGSNGSNVDATASAMSYIASVGVGTPPTQYTLLIDTGSSNTWIGGLTPYNPTSSSRKTDDTVYVGYGGGSLSGTEYIDTLTLSDNLVITKQSIGVDTTGDGFNGLDGILGVGPADLTLGTLSPNVNSTIPTVTDNLFSQGTISSDVLSISFEPAITASDNNGVLTFGGIDSSLFTGDITYVPITRTSNSNQFWGIQQSIDYGSSNILSSTAGILDTGTSLLLIATDAYNAYQSATGGTPDSTGLLTITQEQYSNLKTLYFNVGGTTFGLTPNAQIWPRSLNSQLGNVDPDSIHLVIADIGWSSGTGLDFVNGYPFLERFYTVYDITNSRVGLATTPFTNATSN